MDRLLCVQKKRGTKQAKPKKKTPIKVVYISNPMNFKTSPSEFRSLVQELTGQDSDVADITKFSEIDGGDALHGFGVGGEPSTVRPALSVDSDHHESPASVDSSFEFFDVVFTPQMLENLTGFVPSGLSGVLYEAQVDLLRD